MSQSQYIEINLVGIDEQKRGVFENQAFLSSPG